MSEQEGTPLNEEQLQEARDSTPVRPEDGLVPEEAVEEAATTKESGNEAVSTEGAGAEGHDSDSG